MNKITGVSDGTHLIPVSWKLNAGIADEDIPLHNAIIMGVVMARKINVMRLWDGTINISEKIGKINSNISSINSTIANISENVWIVPQYGNNCTTTCVISSVDSDIPDISSTVTTDNITITPKISTEDVDI